MHFYFTPFLGWGTPVVSAPENEPSRYRYAAGAASGVSVADTSLGVDFVYFSGSKFFAVDSLDDPMVRQNARVHAFRLAANIGYDWAFSGFRGVVVTPHFLAGLEWRRNTVGEASRVDASLYWAPAVSVRIPLREDRFAVGIDARANMILAEAAVELQSSGFLIFEFRF